MKINRLLIAEIFIGIIGLALSCGSPQSKSTTEVVVVSDPLSAWNESGTKQTILDFVTKTTTIGSPDFIAESDRIAVFDNDGTLWAEQPMYFQLAYAIDYIQKNVPIHPEWSTKEPFKSLLDGDLERVMQGGEKSLVEILMVSHAGMSSIEFEKSVKEWLDTAIHPITNKPFNQMIYQPMLELMDYLRVHGYKTFIVSGGGIDFMRVWVENAYGIPTHHVIGSSIKAKYQVVDGEPVITKLPEINFIDDKEGKPIGIHQHIGKRPVIAVGNSDGDYAMLEYTTMGEGPRLGMIIHHTDSVREFAYDRHSPIGHLAKGLDDATKFDWLVVDIKEDWNNIFYFK